MEVKTDTKEKFHVIRVETTQIPANMAAELNGHFLELLKGTIKNVVLNLRDVKNIAEEAAETLVRIQQKFYEAGASYVICELTEEVESFLQGGLSFLPGTYARTVKFMVPTAHAPGAA